MTARKQNQVPRPAPPAAVKTAVDARCNDKRDRSERPGTPERFSPHPSADLVLAGIFCLVIVWLHVLLYRHAGAFWRDEASSLQVAFAPSVGVLWERLSKDSAPVLSYGLLRLWGLAGTGEGWLRAFGTLVSLGVAASLYFSCRMLTGRTPLVGAALVAFNPAVFYFGSSLRAYGLAILFIMPCCALLFRVARQPTRSAAAASLTLALLACHTSYQNSYLLFALVVAGASVCAVCRLWKRAFLIIGIGLAAATSMLVYLPAIRSYREIAETLKSDLTAALLVAKLGEAAGGDSLVLRGAWIALFALALAVLAAQFARDRRLARTVPSIELYFLVAAGAASAAALGFFLANDIVPYPWHYAPMLALAGILVEVALGRLQGPSWMRAAGAGVACGLIALSLPTLWNRAHLRRTNLDVACRIVAERAEPGDLVLVNPFWLAPGFKYHYRGAAAWNTLPLTSTDVEASLLPYAPIKRLMATPNALAPTLESVERTLAAGKRLWVVGALLHLPAGTLPPELGPAPSTEHGWSAYSYFQVWTLQLVHYLREHGASSKMVPVVIHQEVDVVERVRLLQIEGWRAP